MVYPDNNDNLERWQLAMIYLDNKDENFDLWHKRGFTKGARVAMHREPWNIVWCLPLWAAIFKPITKFGAIWQSSLKEGRRGLRPEIRHYSGWGDENRECSGILIQGGQRGGWSNCLVLIVVHLMLFWPWLITMMVSKPELFSETLTPLQRVRKHCDRF